MPAAFDGLRPFLGFNGFGVSMGFARFTLTLFLWAAPVSGFNFVEGFAVQCLRRLSLRCFNGLRQFHADAVSMGCASFWVSMDSAFEWRHRLSGIICLLSR